MLDDDITDDAIIIDEPDYVADASAPPGSAFWDAYWMDAAISMTPDDAASDYQKGYSAGYARGYAIRKAAALRRVRRLKEKRD